MPAPFPSATAAPENSMLYSVTSVFMVRIALPSGGAVVGPPAPRTGGAPAGPAPLPPHRLVPRRDRVHPGRQTARSPPMARTNRAGRHFLQIPGPTNVPDRVLRAIDRPTIDHRGPEFARLGKEVLAGLRKVFRTSQPVVIFPASGTGAWEAALVNTLSPDDRVVMFETGHFATLWHEMARRLDLRPDFVPGDWRHGADPAAVEQKLRGDPQHE